MTKIDISNAINNISTRHIEEAADYSVMERSRKPVWIKLSVIAACFCLIVGAVVLFKSATSTQPGADNMIDTPYDTLSNLPGESRGDTTVFPSVDQTAKPAITGERLSVFENSPVGIDDALMQTISASAIQTGWNELDYTLIDAYSFTLHGGISGSSINRNSGDVLKNTQDFLRDSGLDDLLTDAGIAYELETNSDDGISLSFCYLLCDGERTGAYIRFVFEGSKVLSECQAFVYASECIDSLEQLSFEEALNQAFCVRNNELISVNTADYTIKNEKIVYVNGLPYYSFDGMGINSRSGIKGYALAVDIESSSIKDTLMEKHLAFNLE